MLKLKILNQRINKIQKRVNYLFNKRGYNKSLIEHLDTISGTLRRDKLGNIDYTNYIPPTKIIGGYYYPRKASNPDWVSELVRKDIPLENKLSWGDIEEDLDYLINNRINTIRITLFYNLTTFNTNPLVNTNYEHDSEKSKIIKDFLYLCENKGLKVITQTNFGYEGELSDVDIASMVEYVEGINLDRFNSHIKWVTKLFNRYKDTILAHKIINEPDGFGTWANYDKALKVLKFLVKIKQEFISHHPNLPYLINTVDHINYNLRFTEMPTNEQSIYDLSDWATFNSYYWADNGHFEYVSYKRQWDYMVENNYRNKPLMMVECGFPSDYDNQGPGEESFVPENGQFDRPIGRYPFTPHTQDSQNRAIKEARYYSEKNSAIGILCWSLYKHKNVNNSPHFFQDSFGVIDAEGVKTLALDVLTETFTDGFGESNIKPLSITSGNTGQGAHINGYQGYSNNDVPAGIYLPSGGGYWVSEYLDLLTPYVINFRVKQKTSPNDNGVTLGVQFKNSSNKYHVQFEDYSNRWRLFVDDVEVAASNPSQDFGLEEKLLSFDFNSRTLGFYVDGIKIDFLSVEDSTEYDLTILQILYQKQLQVFCIASTSDVEVLEGYYTLKIS